MRIIFLFLIVVFLSITGVFPLNDWNEPCTLGECHYDLDSSQDNSSGLKTSSGTLKIWGSHKVISDITPAAGWHIIECKENGLEQLVRMVCVSESAPCSHLFSHSGPEGKIVRLPRSCGRNPFGRVASSWVSHDQSLPRLLASRLRKRDGQAPVVYNLILDVKFSDVNPQHGPIRFAIQAATIPNTDTHIDTHLPLNKRSGRQIQRSHKDIAARALTTVKRNLEEFKNSFKEKFHDDEDKIKEKFHDAENMENPVDKILHAAAKDAKDDIQKGASDVGKAIHNVPKVVDKAVKEVKVDADKVAQKAKNVTQKVVDDVKDGVHKAAVEIPKLFHDVVNATEHPKATLHEVEEDAKKPFNITKSIHFSPHIGNRSITLVKATINCPPEYLGVEADLNTNNSTAEGNIGIVVVGTISPLHLIEFRVLASVSADINAMLQINAELTVMYDSGQIKIVEFPLGGIEFPGILSLGPNIAIAVQLVLLYDFAAGTRVEFGFQVENLVLELPKKGPIPHPNMKFKKGSFSLSSTPFVRHVLQAAVHLIPLIELEFKVFDKLGTTLDLQLDNVLVLKLPLEFDKKTHVIKPRELSDRETVAFDARGLLQDMPLVVRSATELALHSWHGSGFTSMVNPSGWGNMFLFLFRRNAPGPPPPGPGPWPGGVGVLPNTNTTEKPQVNGCLEGYYIVDFSVGATGPFKIRLLFGFTLDQNTRFWFFRKVNTLFMDCRGTSQPNGHWSSVGSILKALGSGSFLARRSDDPLLKRHETIKHKCPSHTVGMAAADETGANGNSTTYNVWSLSHTGSL